VNIAPPPGPTTSSGTGTPCRLLTVEEVRVELNIGRTLAYQLVESGALLVVRVGHALRVRRADLDAYVEANVSGRVAR
jgi:excisionase family DNA binding protein